MRSTIKTLFGKYEGHPILVIGGGPSVRTDLPRLVELGVQPACVISANAHGTLQTVFPVDYLVHVDKRHAGLKVWMKDYLGAFGLPLISSHSFANYRLPEIPFKRDNGLNSGLMAIFVAATLGGNPVIVTGVDCWTTGRSYFHDEGVERKDRMPRPASGTARPSAYAIGRAMELGRACRNVRIRPVSGPFTSLFPAFDPREAWRWWGKSDYRRAVENLDCGTYVATTGFQFSSGDRLAEGETVGLSSKEAEQWPVRLLTEG